MIPVFSSLLETVRIQGSAQRRPVKHKTFRNPRVAQEQFLCSLDNSSVAGHRLPQKSLVHIEALPEQVHYLGPLGIGVEPAFCLDPDH